MEPRGTPQAFTRLIALLGIGVLCFTALGGRLVQLQVVEASSYEQLGSKQRVRTVELPGQRGAIYDREMRPLARSIEARAVYANPEHVEDPGASAAVIAPLLDADPAVLARRLSSEGTFVYLARQIDVAVAREVLALRLPGIGTLAESSRVYPAGSLAGQVLGFVGIDGAGLGGVEYGLDETLRGLSGEELIEQDPRGRPIPFAEHRIRPPVPGRDVVLTIDRDIQHAAEAALGRAAEEHGAASGVAVVLEPSSGDVLAMANWPAFDPSLFWAASPERSRNRAVSDVYEPGSVNKVITAAAALEAGVVTPAERFRVPDTTVVGGRTFRDYQPHAPADWNFTDIIAVSSNVGLIKVAERLGAPRLHEALVAFGLGGPGGVGLPGEANGIVLPLNEWYATGIGSIPIGHGVATTPLQMASVYAAIANDGVLASPRLIRGITAPDGEIELTPHRERRRIVSALTAAQIRSILVAAVEHGTGHQARIPGYLVAGKTGTASKPLTGGRGYSRDIVTTFVGIVPADAPRLVVLVALDSPRLRLAAWTAAPAVREIATHALAHLRVPPTFPDGAHLASIRPVGP